MLPSTIRDERDAAQQKNVHELLYRTRKKRKAEEDDSSDILMSPSGEETLHWLGAGAAARSEWSVPDMDENAHDSSHYAI